MNSIFDDERVINYYKKRIKHKRYDIKNEIFLIINDIIETSKVSYETVLTEDEALKFFYKAQEETEELEEITLLGEVALLISKIKNRLMYLPDMLKEVFNV